MRMVSRASCDTACRDSGRLVRPERERSMSALMADPRNGVGAWHASQGSGRFGSNGPFTPLPRSRGMRCVHRVLTAFVPLAAAGRIYAQQITAAGQPAQLDIRVAGEHSVRITLKPMSFRGD